MKGWKVIGKRILFPPGWLLMLLTIISTAGLISVFVRGWDEHPLAYALYALSAYTLTVDCIFFSRTLPGYYHKAKQRVYENPLGNRYMTDTTFKVRVSLYNSLAINLLYSAFKLIAGVYYSSFWWGAIAVYYMVLSLIRFLLLRYMNGGKKEDGLLSEYRRYRLCGILLVLLNLSLTAIVIQMVWQNKEYSYPEIIIIAVATYTFYTVTVSIIDLVKYRKFKSPVMSAAKAIRFAAALVSLLTLETAMLVQYGDDELFRRLMTALTGAGVCIIVLGMSVYMVIRANKEIRVLTINNS